MISPAEIRTKAQRLYPQAIAAWLRGEETELYPWRIPANLKLSDVHSDNVRDVQSLRLSAKETIGYGFCVEWQSRKSRKHGENDFFPNAITFDSRDDLLKLIGKQSEFKSLERKVNKIRERWEWGSRSCFISIGCDVRRFCIGATLMCKASRFSRFCDATIRPQAVC